MALKRYIANRNMIISSDNDIEFYDLSLGSVVRLIAGTYFVEADPENPKQFEVEESVNVSPTSFFFQTLNNKILAFSWYVSFLKGTSTYTHNIYELFRKTTKTSYPNYSNRYRNIPRPPRGVKYYAPSEFVKTYITISGHRTYIIDLNYLYNLCDKYNILIEINIHGLAYAYNNYGVGLYPVDENNEYLFTDYNFIYNFLSNNYTFYDNIVEFKKDDYYVNGLGYLRYLWFTSEGEGTSEPSSFEYNLGCLLKFNFYDKKLSQITLS